MLLYYLLRKKHDLLSIAAHLIVGVLSVFTVYAFVAWFYLIFLTCLPKLINRSTRSLTILLLSGYVLSAELFGRVVNAAPFVPYQTGGYFMIAVYTLAIFDKYRKARTHVGFIILLLCLPGFYMMAADDYITNFFNVFAGIVCTALAAIYFSRQVYTREELFAFLKCAVLPVLSLVALVFIKTPSFSDVEFNLKANFETSGGFGSNQVSTILGAAACFVLVPLLRGAGLFGPRKWINLVLVSILLFRGMLTFSRGGVLGCLLAVLLAYLFITFTDKKNLGKSLLKMVVFAVVIVVIFNFTDQLTGGKLTQRYRGETGGTAEGTREKDLKTMTSGRNEIMEVEWKMFTDNILLGVGPANGYNLRRELIGKTVASHTEVTRLLSEQGTPGLLISLVFLAYPFFRISRARTREEKFYLIALFALAIITSFHSSMRTLLTPVLWGVGCASYRIPNPKMRKNSNTRLIRSRLIGSPHMAEPVLYELG
jgi:hypothetical protein